MNWAANKNAAKHIHATIVSFLSEDSGPHPRAQLSQLYDPEKDESYIEQCFSDQKQIGKGNFGVVIKCF
jgi:hypothetical protein